MQLRPYQEEALSLIKEKFKAGSKGLFLVMPTGAGKTVTFTQLIHDYTQEGKRVAVLAHRGELLTQTSNTLNRYGILNCIVKASRADFALAPVITCSIDSMGNRDLPWEPDLIIIDEAHLINAERYRKFLERYPNARLLLVSATPLRLDGKGFSDFADELIIGTSIKKLIDDGYLVRPRIFTASILHGLNQIKTTAGDFNKKQLENYMVQEGLIGDVLHAYQEHANGLKTVVFASGVEHSKLLTNEFIRCGYRAEHIDGTTPDDIRRDTLDRFHRGETLILSNANVLTEGWDEPTVQVVILARPTQSEALFIQMAGRGLRIDPGNPDKKECVILDHGENVIRHGHILEERSYTLKGRNYNKKEKIQNDQERRGHGNYLECFACKEWFPLGHETCPACNWVVPKPKNLDGKLKEIGDTLPDELQEAAEFYKKNEVLWKYIQELRKCKRKGWRPGAAWYKTVEAFGKKRVEEQLPRWKSRQLTEQFYEERINQPGQLLAGRMI